MTTIDLDALLVALVLSPATYSRNRFFGLYAEPAVRRVRRRASAVRGIVRHLSHLTADERVGILQSATGRERIALAYELPALGLRRTMVLDPLELSLVRYSLARIDGLAAQVTVDEADIGRIQGALHRLGSNLAAPVSVADVSSADDSPC